MCLTKLFPGGEVGWDCGGCWGITRSLAARVCQPPSPTPATSRDQLGTGRTPIASSCFPLSSLSDEEAGSPHEEAPEVQRGTGTPSRSLALHPSRSPHIPDSVGGAPGPRLQSFIAQPTNTPPAPPRVPGTLPCMSHLQALGQPASPVGSPLPLFIWLLPPPAAGLPQPLSDPVDPPCTAVIRLCLAPD